MAKPPASKSATKNNAAKDDVLGQDGDFIFTIDDLLANDPGGANKNGNFFFGSAADQNTPANPNAQAAYLAAHGIIDNGNGTYTITKDATDFDYMVQIGNNGTWSQAHVDVTAPVPPPAQATTGDCLFTENFDSYTILQNYGVWGTVNLSELAARSDGHQWAISNGNGGWNTVSGELVQGVAGSIQPTTGNYWLDTQNSPGGIDISNWFIDPTGGEFKLSFDLGVHDFGTGPMQETAHDATFDVRIDGHTVKTISWGEFNTAEQMQHFELVLDGGVAPGGHTLQFVDTTASQGNFVGFSLDSIKVNDWVVGGTGGCVTPPKVLFTENFDEAAIQTFQSGGVDTSASIDLVSQGWFNTGHTDNFGFTEVNEVAFSGKLGGIVATSGNQWLDTQNTPGGIDIKHDFTNSTAAVGDKTSVLSFDIAKMQVAWDGNPYATDPNASFAFKIDGQEVKSFTASDFANFNEMKHFDIDISGYAKAGNTHTLELVDSTATNGYFGFAVDSIQIQDHWVI